MKPLIAIISFLFITYFLPAQNTATISGIVSDHSTQVWANATWTSQTILPGAGGTAVYHDGTPVPSFVSGQLATDGSASGSLPRSSMIYPTGTYLKITLCPNASAVCVTKTTSITGTTFDFGSFFSNGLAAPVVQSSNMSYAYNQSEIINMKMGDGFTNTFTGIISYWNGNSWFATSSTSAPPIGPAGGDLTGTYPNPTVNTSTVPKLATNNIWTGTNVYLNTSQMQGIIGSGPSNSNGTISSSGWDIKKPLTIESSIVNSTGLQIASGTICAAAISNFCTITVTLPVPMPNNTYNVSGCVINNASQATPVVSNVAAKTTTNFAMNIANVSTTVAGTAVGTVMCLVTQ